MSFSRNFIYNLQTFRGFCLCIFTILLQKSSMKIIFYLPVITDQPKFVAFLVFVCTNDSLIAQIWSFRKCLETRRHLGSSRKTVNT